MPVLCDEARKLDDGFSPGELARAKAQMKAGLLMSLESTSARCEQMAQHMLIHGTPFDPADLVRRIDAVDDAAIARVVSGWRCARRRWSRWGRSASSKISRASKRGSTAEPANGAATQDLPAPVRDPRRAAAPRRRAGVSAPAGARRLRRVGRAASAFAQLF